MDYITDLKTEEETSFVFHTNDHTVANMLRRSMMMNVPTFAINTITTVVNSSERDTSEIALRMGMIPLSKEGILPDKVYTLTAEGPGYVTTKNIPDFPVADDLVFNIIHLMKGQKLVLDIRIAENTAKYHVKHRPISEVGMLKVSVNTPLQYGYKYSYQNLGMISNEELLDKAFQFINTNIAKGNIFTTVMVPTEKSMMYNVNTGETVSYTSVF